MLLVHPDVAQTFGGQMWSQEIADARQEHPRVPAPRAGRCPKARRAFAIAGPWLGEHRGDRSG
jgi:hypothetical protein